MTTFGSELLAALGGGTGEGPFAPALCHVAEVPARPAEPRDWPEWIHPEVLAAVRSRGIQTPWCHQVEAAGIAHSGRHVVLSTGTASGKSLAFQLPILDALVRDGRARALYLSPTKALGHDQLRTAHALAAAIPGLADAVPSAYDGDTPAEVRRFVRERSRWLFSNPDMVHLSLLANHARWAVFLRGLRYLVVDECHYYRGIFGSNVAIVLRRLLRLCQRYASPGSPGPTVIFASATTAAPATTAAELIGRPVAEVTHDGSPHGARTIALWEPELRDDMLGENGAPVRRSAGAEAARMMADLVMEGARTLTFVRSRRGAELTALGARARLEDIAPHLRDTVASYRAGYLAEDRRALERALADGQLRGLASTNALELGIDIAGLDAVLMAGFPGTVASFWQQAGRSGRRGQSALVVLIARDDPLDTYLVHHGLLRRRAGRYFPTAGLDPHHEVDIRGTAGGQVAIVESGTGRLVGMTAMGQAPANVHPGAVYLHQGESYVVNSLDLTAGVALVHAEDPGYSTFAREIVDVTVTGSGERIDYDAVTLGLVPVSVTHRVVGYLRRQQSGEVLDFVELDMPEQSLPTTAAMWTITPESLLRNDIYPSRIPGALHAAEHAAIGLLPLVASCDRGDVGGLSTAIGEGGLPTVFVYDGHAGGAGFAERGYRMASTWLGATADAIEACQCPHGCPSCVQSPKCGNGNDPLDKAGAVRVLRLLLGEIQTR